MSLSLHESLEQLRPRFKGEIRLADLDRMIYSTDASIYQQIPAAVACPRTHEDVSELIKLARQFKVGLIPRAAGTSLAGQVVGAGIVVDVSRFMTNILEWNIEEKWVRVQPGVIRDHLNQHLEKYGLFFAPETSTSNRATIGGMVGNNSCGTNSIVYGTTRDHIIEVTGLLSDGSIATFSNEVDDDNLSGSSFQSRIIGESTSLISDPLIKSRIRSGFPKPEVARRNTGYAIDLLCHEDAVNFCKLIAGSEGTLFFITEIKLRCESLPPSHSCLSIPHFDSVNDALQATQIVMRHCERPETKATASVFACELIDRFVIDGAARNLSQKQILRFINGNPNAVLLVGIRGQSRDSVIARSRLIQDELILAGLGCDFSTLFDEDEAAIWNLRKAGLGVIVNVPGDAKPITIIEDMAVALEDLPSFIAEVDQLLEKLGLPCAHYGHAGAGELHLRPVIDLHTSDGQILFRQLATEVATIVRKYRGSLSGEHGDGRLRSEFLKSMIGDANFELLTNIKQIWDPDNIFNPGKIVDSVPIDQDLRFDPDAMRENVTTTFDFRETNGLLRAAEMCSGSGDCRKTELSGGVMCPSFMATKDERDTTRARANVVRQVLTEFATSSSSDLFSRTTHPLADPRVAEVMDLCLACKACKSECPSNVDMAKMKAEFLHQNNKANGVSKRTRRFGNFTKLARRATWFPNVTHWLATNKFTSGMVQRRMGIHGDRSLPKFAGTTLRKWWTKHTPHMNAGEVGQVILFCDEFTNYIDVSAGIASVELLERFGYKVRFVNHVESGRSAISQGLLDDARKLARTNVEVLHPLVTPNRDLQIVGVEPSALLTLRDEYPSLVGDDLREQAEVVARRTFLIDEFISNLIERQQVPVGLFTDEKKRIRLHGHCHQKTLSSMKDTIRMLQLPPDYRVKMIPAGCCGMAGSFGYEKEHYELSMKIGELVLFPTIREEPVDSIIAAGGTSCRHQILDGTGRVALHPVEILRDALVD